MTNFGRFLFFVFVVILKHLFSSSTSFMMFLGSSGSIAGGLFYKNRVTFENVLSAVMYVFIIIFFCKLIPLLLVKNGPKAQAGRYITSKYRSFYIQLIESFRNLQTICMKRYLEIRTKIVFSRHKWKSPMYKWEIFNSLVFFRFKRYYHRFMFRKVFRGKCKKCLLINEGESK